MPSPLPHPWRLPRAFCLALLVAGCSTSPVDLRDALHAVEPSAAWSQSGGPLDAQARDTRWLQWMDDPRLEQLMAEALAGAPDLRTARARLQESRARADLALSVPGPSLDASTSAARSRTSRAAGVGGTGNVFDAGFDASWEIDLFDRQHFGIEAAQADLRASEADLDDARVTLLAEVARLYSAIAVLQVRVEVAQRALDSQAGIARTADWRASAGTGSRLDALQAKAVADQTRAQIHALINTQAQTRQALAVLAGKTPEALDARLADALPVPRVPDRLAIGIPADTLRQRADVRAAEAQLLAGFARSEEARAAMMPTLILSGTLGLQALSLGALTGGQAGVASLGAAFAGPIYDSGSRLAQWHIQNAIQQQAAVAYEQTVLNALSDVEAALVALRSAQARADALTASVDAAREAARLAGISHDAGLVDFDTVLNAQRTLQTVEDSLAVAQGDALAALIRLYKGLGGGWDTGAPSPDPTSTVTESRS